MNSKSYVQSVKPKNEQIATSSKHQETRSEQKTPSHEQEQHYLPGKSLCLAPLPKNVSVEDLVNFFCQFGTIKRHHVGQNFLWVEYINSKPVDILTNKPHWLHNEKLCLKRLKKNGDNFGVDKMQEQKNTNTAPQKNVNKIEEEDPIRYDCIKNVIENEVSFYNQLAALLNAVQLTEYELTTRYNVICPHLDDIFRMIFPECRTYRFGSTVAQLSFKESDLDIYMYIGRAGLPPICHRSSDIPSHMWTPMIFNRVRKVMYSMKSVFSNIISIPKAKTPIIKFRYIPTNVSCDISFKNGLGIYKSNFLRYCASRDLGLRPLMLLIKYWARHFGISGNGRISSYGLVCLIIFYLQQESVGLLPPLLDLRRTCAPQIMNGWQVNFDENTPLPAVTNNSSIATLLHNFFSFYGQFNFNSCVLCLLDGKTYSVADFTQLDKLPDYMDRYKTYVMNNSIKKLDTHKPVCVQDPIELNQNTAANTSDRALIAFQHCCKFSADVCSTASENNYDYLLSMLFSAIPPQLMPKKKKRKNFRNMIKAGRFLLAGLPEDFKTRTDIDNKEQYEKDNWYFVTFNLIRDIFEMIFKLQVEVLLDQEAKQQKIEVLSDVHTRNSQKVTFHCTGNKCVWYNRKKNNRTLLDLQLSLLEKEAIMSDKVVEQLKKHDKANNIKLDFIYTVEKADNPIAVILILKDENSQDHIFREFECIVNSWVPKIITKTLLHMLQFKKTYDQLLFHQQSL